LKPDALAAGAPLSDGPLTAFEKTEERLRECCAAAEFDVPSFNRKLARCDLSSCRGMCCYDGVYVDEHTGQVLEKLALERKADFQRMGLDLPERILVEDRWRPSTLVTDRRTALREFPFASVVDGYPAHFRQTACIFLLADGRCGLQVLAGWDGKHPWYYKPIPCSLHPISISPEAITVHDELTDRYRFPWYDGYVVRTFCGRTCSEGRPAMELLEDELAFLAAILARDIIGPASGEPRQTDGKTEDTSHT
jgi:hypothetical protein